MSDYGSTPPPPPYGGGSEPGNPYGQPYGSPQQPQQPQQPYGAPPPAYGAQPAAQQPYGQPYGAAAPYDAPPAYGAGASSFGAPASMGKRLLARLLDGLIVGIPVGIIYGVIIAGAVSSATVDPTTGEVTGGGGVAAGALLAYPLIILIYIGYEVGLIATRGATIGKSVLGIKVVREADGQVPGWGPSFLRWLIPVVGGFACGIGQIVVYLSPFFDNSGRQQGWHDKVAKTLVVQK